jgi:drug/metabolite transporter (DMT)-like permease
MTTEPRAAEAESAPAPSADLLLLVAVSLWALNYAVIKFGVSQISPLTFIVLRWGLGGLVMAAVLYWREGTLRVARADLPMLLAAAVLGVSLNQLCFVYSLTNTGASDVALLGATGPLVTALLATAVGLERLGRRHWLSALVGLGGVVLIIAGGANSAFGQSPLLGDALALGSTLCSSASVLPIRPLLRRYSAWRILTFEMLVGSLLLLPLALPSLVAQDYGRVTLAGWGSLGYAVVLTGVLTNLLYFTAIGRVGPSRAAMFGYLQSFLGVLFAVALLGERVTALQLAGGLVVIGSVIMSRSRLIARPSAR